MSDSKTVKPELHSTLDTRHSTRARGLAFRVTALLLAFSSVLFLAELILQVSNVWAGRHSDTMFELMEHDPLVGWRMIPNQSFSVDLVDVEDIPVTSNSSGFWDDELAPAPADLCRIAFLGDSFTWGFGVRRDERFSHWVGRSSGWRTMNFGMPGYGADQSLLVWRRHAFRFQPMVTVLTLYQNDYGDAVSQIRNGRAKPYFELTSAQSLELRNVPVETDTFWEHGMISQIAPPYRSVFPSAEQRRSRLAHWLSKNSDLARLGYTLYRSWRFRAAAAENPGELYQVIPLSPHQKMEFRLMGELLRQFKREVEKSGARLLVVLAGDAVPQFGYQLEQMEKDGIAWLDLTTPVLQKGSGLSRQEIYFPYNKHWTPEAHRTVGQAIAAFIREENWCPVP